MSKVALLTRFAHPLSVAVGITCKSSPVKNAVEPSHPSKIFSSGKFTLFLGKLLRDVVLILLIQEKSAFLITARLLNVQMKWNYDFFHAQSAHWEVPKGRESCLRRSFRHLKLLNITFVIDFKVLKQKVFVAFSLSFLGLLALSSFCQLLGN